MWGGVACRLDALMSVMRVPTSSKSKHGQIPLGAPCFNFCMSLPCFIVVYSVILIIRICAISLENIIQLFSLHTRCAFSRIALLLLLYPHSKFFVEFALAVLTLFAKHASTLAFPTLPTEQALQSDVVPIGVIRPIFGPTKLSAGGYC